MRFEEQARRVSGSSIQVPVLSVYQAFAVVSTVNPKESQQYHLARPSHPGERASRRNLEDKWVKEEANVEEHEQFSFIPALYRNWWYTCHFNYLHGPKYNAHIATYLGNKLQSACVRGLGLDHVRIHRTGKPFISLLGFHPVINTRRQGGHVKS